MTLETTGRAPLRVAIVGAGGVAHLHAQALADDDRVALVAVAEPDPARRTEFAARYGIPAAYPDHGELLAAESLDLVHLCTPPHLHRRQALDAFAAGADVLCEKPPALSLVDLAAMEDAAAASDRRLGVTFQQRTGTAAAHVKRLLDDGALGRPLLAQCQTLWHRDVGYYAVDWRGTWASEGGGTTFGHGIHQLDLLTHLLGDWAEVDARLWRLARDIEMEDVSTATIRFANGAVAQAASSVLSPRETSVIRLDTTLATVEVEHLYGHGAANWRITPAPGVDAAGWKLPATDEPSGHTPLIRAVVDALWEGRPFPDLVTGARRTLELVTAVYASATHGRSVTPADLRTDQRFRASLAADVTDLRPYASTDEGKE
ncbi:oxidoreductase domain protein [Xylanimonas cellulosilytica DSM 15894]|uniref:Oxidoreductase domain protein n=1 Tax=Xylanimonas cellulosilytica (strain DSM 15894 / JCM 12276 / CECT 5975 / KCTC 9989 / LMG 20990 / NBRC 107835 / XIL07) TaxID=446471 RepID=D1BY81_XYLCX|nr:Gfo/Idh/MocA family oxidoreductase [Xylanimonas cellulosilytica]ACZ29924.1 oxidoreductase domain protein [Xylanimonas cellulosilytica DSM 15894]